MEIPKTSKWRQYDLKIRKYIWDYKKTHPCVKCGEADPIVLIFDHLDPRTKDSNVSNVRSFKKLKEEIDKCQILCCNCHARLTSEQFGWYRQLQQEAKAEEL